MTDPTPPLVRVAAIADTHIRPTSVTRESVLAGLEDLADVLLVAGDITDSGRIPEVEIAASAFRTLNMPIYAVLGNHDRRGLRRMAMRKTLAAAGVRLLDGEFDILQLRNGTRVGIAGITGTGGGFGDEKESDGRGGRLTRAVMLKSRREAARLDKALGEMATGEPDISVLVTHFAPTTDTLGAEPPLKYWMLGNAGLGKVIDDHHLDLVIHGHAHHGNEEGTTPGGTPVRNVAAPLVGQIMVYHVGPGRNVEHVSGPRPAMIDHDDPVGTASSLPAARP